jgi:hypothetical protein
MMLEYIFDRIIDWIVNYLFHYLRDYVLGEIPYYMLDHMINYTLDHTFRTILEIILVNFFSTGSLACRFVYTRCSGLDKTPRCSAHARVCLAHFEAPLSLRWELAVASFGCTTYQSTRSHYHG